MDESPQKSVVLAGRSPSIRDVLKDILASYGVRMCGVWPCRRVSRIARQ